MKIWLYITVLSGNFMNPGINNISELDSVIENDYKITDANYIEWDSVFKNDESYLLRKAYYLIINNKGDKAELELNRIHSLRDNSYFLMCKALLSLSKDDVPGAESTFELALKKNDGHSNHWLYYELARFYLNKDQRLSYNYLEKSLKIKHDFTPALILQASMLDPMVECDTIIKILEPLIFVTNNKDALNHLANAYFSCGLFKKSKETFSKSIELWSDNPDGYYGLGFLAEEYERDTEKAMVYYNKSILQDSTNYQVQSDLAWLYFDTHRIDESKKTFERLRLLSDDQQEVINQVVRFYCYLEDYISARKTNFESYEKNKSEIDFIENEIIVKYFETDKKPDFIFDDLMKFGNKFGDDAAKDLMRRLADMK